MIPLAISYNIHYHDNLGAVQAFCHHFIPDLTLEGPSKRIKRGLKPIHIQVDGILSMLHWILQVYTTHYCW